MPRTHVVRSVTVVVATAGLLLTSALPASAYPYETGTRSCAVNYFVGSKTKGSGEMYARVETLAVYTYGASVRTLYNTDQYWLRSNVNWETGAQFNYDYAFSDSFCEHV